MPSPVIGHLQAQSTLNTLLEKQQLPHAILLFGPEGIGKRLLAETTAQALMCGKESSDTISPNTSSPIYAQIQSGSTPDYIVLEPESGKKSIGIEQTRTLLSDISLSSDTSKAIIIDAAEQLTTEAANALLKTLEEPSKNTHFFLICHQYSKLLPTIISRCRPIRMSPLSQSDTERVLASILDTNAPKCATENDINRQWAAKNASGQPGIAIKAFENGTPQLQQEILDFMKILKQPIEFVEKINKKKQTQQALEILHSVMSQNEQLKDNYIKLSKDLDDLETYNLTASWVLEDALKSLPKTI